MPCLASDGGHHPARAGTRRPAGTPPGQPGVPSLGSPRKTLIFNNYFSGFMNVVVVESPAKAKTINKYLGSDYTVLASYGHIRDLPAKDGSVRPDDDFSMDWATDPKSDKHIKDIATALKGAESLILATDPDREGEAISWH